MTTADRPPCTGTCSGPVADLITLPCGCVDVHYLDGTICYEHNHVRCTKRKGDSVRWYA